MNDFRNNCLLHLMWLVQQGAGPMSDDDGLIHGPIAAPNPDWRVNAILAGCRHEVETLWAQSRRRREAGR